MDSYLCRLQEAIASATRGITPEQLLRHSEGKWSVGDILEHLFLTYTGTIKGFERCLTSGKLMVSPPSVKQRVSRLVVVDLGYMPSGRTAPEMTRPTGTVGDRVAQEIVPKIQEMDAVIARCEEKFGDSVCVLNHPIIGPLTAGQWCKFHWVHGMHHVKQIERLRKAGSS